MTDLSNGTIDVRVPCDRCEATGCDQCDHGVAFETVSIRQLARTIGYLDAEERAEAKAGGGNTTEGNER